MPTRLEFIGGNSAKFWEVSQAGCNVTVRYGRIGASGQSQTKTLPTPTAATHHLQRLLDQKLAKGYVERTAA